MRARGDDGRHFCFTRNCDVAPDDCSRCPNHKCLFRIACSAKPLVPAR